MLLKEIFYNLKCDCCGNIANEEMWINEPSHDEILGGRNWKHLDGKDYCEDCWWFNDEDNIETKDGSVFDEDTEELLNG